MTMQEVVARELAEAQAYEARTVACKIGGREYTIADLRAVFDQMCDRGDWKAPCAAAVPQDIVGVCRAALEFFHGCRAYVGGIEPLTGKVLVGSNGYAG